MEQHQPEAELQSLKPLVTVLPYSLPEPSVKAERAEVVQRVRDLQREFVVVQNSTSTT